MDRNILILENGDMYRQQLVGSLRLQMKDPNIRFALVGDIGSLFEKLRLNTWDLIIINFEVPSLNNMAVSNIEAFVNEIKEIIPNIKSKIIGFTGCSELSKKLLQLGVITRQKEYNQKGLKEVLGSLVTKVSIKSNESPDAEIGKIQLIVCQFFNVPVHKMKLSNRKEKVIKAKHTAMHLAKIFTKLSLKEIGQSFGGRDHSTVLHAIAVVKEKMEEDPLYKRDVDLLTEKVLALGLKASN